MDVDAIPLGVNFATVLRNEVAKCEVLLAVIGPHWLDARDEAGTRRLDDPQDFVRIEIGAALHRNIPVIPILLDGAKVPKANQLPKDLEELSMRNGLDVRHTSFHNDIDRLVRSLKGQLSEADAEKRRHDEEERRRQEAEVKQREGEEELRRKAEAEKLRQDEEERRRQEIRQAEARQRAEEERRREEAATKRRLEEAEAEKRRQDQERRKAGKRSGMGRKERKAAPVARSGGGRRGSGSAAHGRRHLAISHDDTSGCDLRGRAAGCARRGKGQSRCRGGSKTQG